MQSHNRIRFKIRLIPVEENVATQAMGIDSQNPKLDTQELLTKKLERHGFELTAAEERLKAFYAIESAYLSIFLALGGFGLILGVAGMGAIVWRNISDRNTEIEILRATGFTRNKIRQILSTEYLSLLIAGILCGSLSAMLAISPNLFVTGVDVPWGYLFKIAIAITLTDEEGRHAAHLEKTLQAHLRLFPAVWIFQSQRRLDWADQVLPDNDAVGEIAYDYLAQQNAKSVVAVNFRQDHATFHHRVRSFEQAAKSTGLACNTINSDDNAPIPALQRVLKSKSKPDGIFCPGDTHDTLLICNAIREAGLEPMRDIRVISCANDVSHLRSIHPDLPNIDIQPDSLGRTATERMLWRIDNPKEPTQTDRSLLSHLSLTLPSISR